MAEFLSESWIASLPSVAGDAGTPGPTATISVEVSAGRGSDVKWSLALDDGRIVETGLGPRADTAVQFTITRPDAEALLTGALTPDVAFMRGQLKAAGDMERVLAVLAWSATDAFTTLRERVAAATAERVRVAQPRCTARSAR